MPNRRPVTALLCTLALLANLTGCGGETPSAATQSAPTPTTMAKSIETRFSIAVGSRTVRMQLALRSDEQERGLMWRESLEKDEGMLFVFRAATKQSFWMRNTPLPLDIGYFDASGVLREVHPLNPFDEQPVSSTHEAIKFALEVKQGWFAAEGVKPGDKLDIAALLQAVRARGWNPEHLNL